MQEKFQDFFHKKCSLKQQFFFSFFDKAQTTNITIDKIKTNPKLLNKGNV